MRLAFLIFVFITSHVLLILSFYVRIELKKHEFFEHFFMAFCRSYVKDFIILNVYYLCPLLLYISPKESIYKTAKNAVYFTKNYFF